MAKKSGTGLQSLQGSCATMKRKNAIQTSQNSVMSAPLPYSSIILSDVNGLAELNFFAGFP